MGLPVAFHVTMSVVSLRELKGTGTPNVVGIWPALLIPGVIFAPESPAYLVRRNKIPQAVKSVQRLTASTSPQAVEDSVNLMVYTNAVEAAMAINTSYTECFKGHDRRRTEIAVGAWISQVTCGSGEYTKTTCRHPLRVQVSRSTRLTFCCRRVSTCQIRSRSRSRSPPLGLSEPLLPG